MRGMEGPTSVLETTEVSTNERAFWPIASHKSILVGFFGPSSGHPIWVSRSGARW